MIAGVPLSGVVGFSFSASARTLTLSTLPDEPLTSAFALRLFTLSTDGDAESLTGVLATVLALLSDETIAAVTASSDRDATGTVTGTRRTGDGSWVLSSSFCATGEVGAADAVPIDTEVGAGASLLGDTCEALGVTVWLEGSSEDATLRAELMAGLGLAFGSGTTSGLSAVAVCALSSAWRGGGVGACSGADAMVAEGEWGELAAAGAALCADSAASLAAFSSFAFCSATMACSWFCAYFLLV
jgi:hypothetical protein